MYIDFNNLLSVIKLIETMDKHPIGRILFVLSLLILSLVAVAHLYRG